MAYLKQSAIFLVSLTTVLAFPTDSRKVTVTDDGPFVKGTNHTLTCTVTERSTSVLKWMQGNIVEKIIVYCHKKVCNISQDYKGLYSYSRDPFNDIFYLTILNINETYNGTTFICRDGTNNASIVLTLGATVNESRESEESDAIIILIVCCLVVPALAVGVCCLNKREISLFLRRLVQGINWERRSSSSNADPPETGSQQVVIPNVTNQASIDNEPREESPLLNRQDKELVPKSAEEEGMNQNNDHGSNDSASSIHPVDDQGTVDCLPRPSMPFTSNEVKGKNSIKLRYRKSL